MKDQKRSNKTYRIQDGLFYISAISVFAAFVVITVWGSEGLLKLMALHEQRAKLVKTNYQLLQENLIYLEEIKDLKKPRYVEQIARSKMGLVRPNEIVFVIKN